MINSVSSMNSYTPTIRPDQGPNDRFQTADTDSSGGISTSELESFASSIEETTGTTINMETAMETYDLDGDDQLSGEELFTLVSEYGLQPSASEAGQSQGGGGPSKGEGQMMPPPPPTQSSFLLQEETSTSETNTIEELYSQLLEKVSSAYGYSEEMETLLNQTA